MVLFRRVLSVSTLVLASAGIASTAAYAQQTQQPPATPDASQQVPPPVSDAAQQEPANPDANLTAPPPQTVQQRAQVLREAQTRVMARRRIREQQVEQDTYSHKYEFYAGAGYLRFRPGHYLQHNTNVAWNAGLTDWVRPKLGVTVDFRGYYGTAITNSFDFQVFKPSISQYTFMAGPQYRFFQGLHWAWNAQVLAGVSHSNFGTGTRAFPADLVGLYPDSNSLAISVGTAVDYNLSPALAVRLMPNYLLTHFGGDIQHNLGYTAGVVYRFGRR